MRDHSQCGESTWILENLKPPVGTFCEVGAFDGIRSSNTLLFEDLGWLGWLIEPDPLLAHYCRQNRKALTIEAAAVKESQAFGAPGYDFKINQADRGLSGYKSLGTPVYVPHHRLDAMLKGMTPDLLSIDTEGTELDVWAGCGVIRPKIVIMEYQTCDLPPNDVPIVERMRKDGYTEVHRTQYNLIFRRD